MVVVEKLNRLTNGQQKSLHESVGKFLEENLQGMKELGLVDETILVDYIAKTDALREDLRVRKADPSLNDTLCAILAAASDSTSSLPAELIHHFTLRYQQMKNVDECLKLIHTFNGQPVTIDEFTAITDATTTIALDDDVVYINYSLPVTKEGWQLIQNLNELHITLDGQQYVADSGDFYIESSKDDLGEEGRFTGRIRINRFAGSTFAKEDKAYFRCLIPIGSVDWNRDIRIYAAFIKNGWILGLLELKDGSTLLHVYPCNDGDKKYMVVESLTPTTSWKMAEYVYSVALTLGFITGTIHLGKCYEFSSSEPEFDANVAMAYHTMRPSSDTGMKIFTTNMYYVRETLKSAKVQLQDKTPLYNEKGEFQEHLQDWLQPDQMQRLFALIHGDAKVARAVVTIIESANFPLEYQASVRAIVLETLAHSVPGPKPIPDDDLWNLMKTDFEAVVAKYVTNETGEQQISDESLTILGKKINTMNNPTNADSLARPLEEAGYDLKPNDKDALKMRNTFLHGGLVKGSVEKQTNEIFYLSLMLHKLACIIILKRAGFSGYILNNPVLFNCEKAVKSGEKVLIKI